MSFRRIAWVAVVAIVAAAAYGIYAPETADRLGPALGALAHRAHGEIWAHEAPPSGQGQPTAAGQGQSGVAPIAVTVTPVKRADFPVVLESIGQVQAYNTVLVRARVDGQINKIAFSEGQMVKQGDLLAQIDPRPFQAALDQAVAKKAQDEANLANAKLDLTRYATLAKQDFATKQQLDTQNALVLAAHRLDCGRRRGDRRREDPAGLHDHPRADLRPRRVPADRRGQSRQRRPADRHRLDRPTCSRSRSSSPSRRNMSIRINQELAAGSPEVTVMDADGHKLAAGRLTISDNQVDLATGTIRLKAEFENKDNALWPGLAVTTGLQLGVDKNVLIVPAEAVQHGQNGLYVFVVDDQNRAQVRQVKVAHQNTNTAVISDGLKEGDRVVTSGQFLLQPGSIVSIDTGSGT